MWKDCASTQKYYHLGLNIGAKSRISFSVSIFMTSPAMWQLGPWIFCLMLLWHFILIYICTGFEVTLCSALFLASCRIRRPANQKGRRVASRGGGGSCRHSYMWGVKRGRCPDHTVVQVKHQQVAMLHHALPHVAKICKFVSVRYHTGGSMKLNACILHLTHMVYL
jgi:hypothetical protein